MFLDPLAGAVTKTHTTLETEKEEKPFDAPLSITKREQLEKQVRQHQCGKSSFCPGSVCDSQPASSQKNQSLNKGTFIFHPISPSGIKTSEILLKYCLFHRLFL